MNGIYEFSTVDKIISGRGCIVSLGKEILNFGNKALVVTGTTALKKTGIANKIEKILKKDDIEYIFFDKVTPEPEIELVAEAIDVIRREKCTCVIGIGGGSVLDVAKAAAGLVNSSYSVKEHFEGKEVRQEGIPYIAAPTTSGSGAEVTPNSVLSDKAYRIKKSIRGGSFLARVVFIDPELTINLPANNTAYSGMDALVQAIESYTSKHSNPFTEGLSLKSVKLISQNLIKVYEDGQDINARSQMAYGSVLAGIALANARLGAVHGIAHPVGALYNAPHGLVCGILLPEVIKYNIGFYDSEKLSSKNTQLINRYCDIARGMGIVQLTDDRNVIINDLLDTIKNLQKELNIPCSLKEIGLKREDIPHIASNSMGSGSMNANPREMSKEDVEKLLNCYF